jgi:rhamnopyranosyl-N-acetylglucosaminyl-diphospho-decaprenol beta-1,3/1,4-galactofuranosyltransferase
MPEAKVVATIVTRDRKDLLRESLNAVFGQTRPVKEAVVVDNASTDGTAEMLSEEFPGVTVVALAENQGAAGGACEAIAAAMRTEFDWLWLLDDDSIARPDALAELFSALEELGPSAPALLCSRVEWRDGSPHVMNLPIMPRERDRRLVHDAREGILPVRAATYVSLLLSRAAVEGAGLPPRHFFWQTDDIEYTARILRDARGYYVARSVVEHRTPTQYTAINDDRRFYFHIRNTILMIRGRAWRAREKPRLVWWIVQTSLVYLRINHLRPRSVMNLFRGLMAGVRSV